MASDAFTGSDGTGLETHDAQWTGVSAGYPVTTLEINGNVVEHEAAWQFSGAYYAASSEDTSQIVFKAGTNGTDLRNVAVRMGSNNLGYAAAIDTRSAGNYTRVVVKKNGTFLATLNAAASFAVNADHTVKITASGTTTVTIQVWVDGVSQGTTEDSSSPLGAGSPGFFTGELGTVAEGRYDDWTDGAAAGTAYPYTGAQGVGAISRSVQTVLAKGKSPTSSGVFARSAATEKARGKIPTVGGGYSLNASTVKARGRVPTVGGSMSFSADAVYENATLYLYAAGGDQVYGAASEYSKTAGAAGTAFAYVGQGVIVFSDGSEHAIGRVYESGGAFHFAGGAVYSLSADLPSAYLYTGAGVYSFQSATERAQGKVYDGAGAYSFQSGVVRIIGRVRFTSQEAVFVRSGGAEVSVEHSTERPELETKPLARSASHEALPTRPPGQDGFYTEPGQDGFYDEYPVDGFYADIGYFKEFKPFHRGASREAAPVRPAGQDGFYTEPGQDGFYDEYPAQGFYADIGYPKEFKPLRRATFTKEGKPS